MTEWTPDQVMHRAITGDMSSGQYRVMQVNAETALREEKARLFDVLAARIKAGEWTIPDGVSDVVIAIRRTGERVHGATLEEAVRKAMEAEGER